MIRPAFNDITLQPVFAFWIVEWARVRKMRLGQPAQVSSIELSTTGVFVLILLTFSLISIFVNPIYALSSTAISNQTWKVTDGGNPVNMAGFPKISTFTSDPSNRQFIGTSNLPEFQHTFASLGTADGQTKSLQLLVSAVPNATTKKPVRERTIVFPTNLSMGTLYIRSWKTTDSWSWQKVEEMSDGTMVPISVPSWISFDPTWRELGIAQDTVVVPAGMELMLDVDRFASDNLSPLTHLAPNDLQHLDLSYLNRDTELVHLHKLTELKGIDFQEANLYDKGLTHLNNLKHLKELNLRRTYISDAGLAHLKGLTNLKVLDLRDTQISDAGLAHLAELTSLVSLSLPFLVTDKGLAHLMRLTELRELNLESAHISNVGLANLAELTSLEVLNLGSTRISNAGLHHLRNLINLKVLNLFGTRVNIDGTGLDHLKQLTSLEVLIFNPPGPLDPMEGIPRPATTDMPTGRFSLSTSVVSGKIYAIGGSNGDMALPTVEVYNPETGTWTQKTDMPTARHSLSTSVVDGKIYAIGGSNGDIVLPTVEAYDPAADT